MELLKKTGIFLILNFTALAIGGLFTGNGVASDWYALANKAPWTPPGWVFGVAWTSIMITFAVYMAFLLSPNANTKKIKKLYLLQWMLNILWNPFFFYAHNALLGLVCITALTVLIAYFFFNYLKQMRYKTLLLSPYLLWLLIATSLNLYFLVYN